MKKFLLSFGMACSLIVATSLIAGDFDVVSGNPADLAAVKSFLIEMNYDSLTVKQKKEADYVKVRIEEGNKKEAGKGDKWLKSWEDAKNIKYAESFEKLFNKVLDEYKVTASLNNKTAKYKIIIRTTSIEPGFNVGIMRKPAAINADIIVVEIAKPSKVILQIKATDIPGAAASGFDFDELVRIREGYSKLGKMVAKLLEKKAYDK